MVRRCKNVARVAFVAACLALMTAPAAFGENLYGYHYTGRDLYRVSETDASVTLVGNTGLTIGGMELYTDGFLYGITGGSGSTLYRIDPSNAQATEIGPLGFFVFEGALAFSPEGVLYGTNGDSAGNPQLFTVDLDTGAATVIGTISDPPHDVNGLAWRSDGMLVGLDGNTNTLIEIDPSNANSSVITTLTPAAGNAGGMAVLGGVGYFATGGPVVNGSNELYAFDLFTGEHTLVGGFPEDIITGIGMGGLAAPEPGSLSLLALVSMIAGSRRRW
ncbi:MAG TPA: PEP-CTERM sorting domain-containing protein [Phycisphaerae bacterium]|nr:PEP-CTERM sorting domain-containing protein [Phycisphaerae bacterium]